MSPAVTYFIIAALMWPAAYKAIQRHVTRNDSNVDWEQYDSIMCSCCATCAAFLWPASLFVFYVMPWLVNRKWFQPPDR